MGGVISAALGDFGREVLLQLVLASYNESDVAASAVVARQCRGGHYRAKLDLRFETPTEVGAVPAVDLDPNDSISVRAQNPTDLGKLRVWLLSVSATPPNYRT
jgi:hypothetical protein